jgi:hypothetical protein
MRPHEHGLLYELTATGTNIGPADLEASFSALPQPADCTI